MRRIVAALVLLGCEPPPAVPPENPNAAPQQPDTGAETAQAETGDAATEQREDAPQDNLPSGADVLARSVDAVGGKDKIDAIKSYYQETQLDIPAQNIKAVTRTWWKGGSFYTETEMTQVGTTQIWKTEEGLWSQDPINGLREITGAEARQHEWANALVIAAEWEKYFDTAETKGRRYMGKATVVDIELTSGTGDKVTLTVDENTWLVTGQSFVQESPMGKMPITVEVREYKDYDGFKAASVSVMDMKVLQATQRVVKFEPNAEIDDAKLVPPNAKGKKKAKPKPKPKGKAKAKDEPET